jgi:hypothetical protein
MQHRAMPCVSVRALSHHAIMHNPPKRCLPGQPWDYAGRQKQRQGHSYKQEASEAGRSVGQARLWSRAVAESEGQDALSLGPIVTMFFVGCGVELGW